MLTKNQTLWHVPIKAYGMFLFNMKYVLISVTMSCFRFMWYISCQCSIWFWNDISLHYSKLLLAGLREERVCIQLEFAPESIPCLLFIFALKGYEPELSDNIRINGKRCCSFYLFLSTAKWKTCLLGTQKEDLGLFWEN